MVARDEQETSVTQGRADDYVEIWTNNIVDIRALEKRHPTVKRVEETLTGDALKEYLDAGFGFTYRVPTDHFHPLKGFKRQRRAMTPEEKQAAAERLRQGRIDSQAASA